VSHVLFALGWAAVGAVAGQGLNLLSRQLAKLEEIEFVQSRLEVLLMPGMAALVFLLFALQLGSRSLLYIDSVYAVVLIQVFAFDLKTRYILDLVIFPSWAIAFGLAFVTPWTAAATWPWPDWRTAPVAGLLAGLVFLLLYEGGQFFFGEEAFGFGDVKLAVLIGLSTGVTNLRVAHALLYGVILGGLVAIILLITRIRSMNEAVPYGPFLVVGTLIALYVQAP
jgi:leader peptidase (prepilin peptidase) / N-methyltransferase